MSKPTGPACGNNPNHPLTDGDRQAVADFKAYLADRAVLRDRIAAAIWERQNPGRRWADCEYRWRADAEEDAAAVLAVLPPPADRAAVERIRAVLETEAVVGRSALEYRGLIASALMADEAQQQEAPATLSGRIARRVAEDARAVRSDLYDDLDAFARETGIPGLQHAQIRDRLAEFLFEGLLRRAVAVPAVEAQQDGAQP